MVTGWRTETTIDSSPFYYNHPSPLLAKIDHAIILGRFRYDGLLSLKPKKLLFNELTGTRQAGGYIDKHVYSSYNKTNTRNNKIKHITGLH